MDEIPQAASDDVRCLLQMVWDKLEESDHWPTFADIERAMWRQHRINAAKLIARTPQALLYGGRPQGGAEPAQDGQLALTVAGAAACSGSEQALEVVVTAARLAADSYLSEDPEDPHVNFTRVADELSLDGARRSDLARRSSMLLVLEPWRSNTNFKPGDWTIWVDGRIRYYAGVSTLEDYWQARQAQLDAGLRSPLPSPTEQDPITGQITRVVVTESNDTANEPTATAEATSQSSSHPITPILTTGVGLYVIFLAVVQATKTVWAQRLGSILVGLGFVALYVSWRCWFRHPNVRKTALAITALLGVAVVAVTIRGNEVGDTPASNSPTVIPPASTTAVHGTASITIEPRSGHAGITVSISAKGFAANEMVRIEIFNGALIRDFQGPYPITDTQANPVGEISVLGTIPAELCCPKGFVLVRATGRSSKTAGTTQFTLT